MKLPGARMEVNATSTRPEDPRRRTAAPVTMVMPLHRSDVQTMTRSTPKSGPPSRGCVQSFPPHDLGAWGEETAAHRLDSTGWTIVARNLTWGRREIDLVARRGSLLAFVEVKTRSGAGFGGPEGAVTWKKRREIETVARAYLARHPHPALDVRFDVIAIVCDDRRRLLSYRHIEDAWRPDVGPP